MSVKGDVVVDAILMLEAVLERELPILTLEQTAMATDYIDTGAFQSPFFLVCNQDDMAEGLKKLVKERKQWMQSLSAAGKEPESDQ